MNQRYKVMLVDDEKDVMDVVRKKIQWHTIGLEEPVYAQNGLEALDIAEEVKPDIVLTDIKMPYMDGLELARQLKQLYPNIRIIILSGFDEFEYAKEAVRLNAEEYLLKPIDSIHLTEVFKKIIQKLDDDLTLRRNHDMLEAYYRESLPVLRENFFVSLVQGKILESQIPQYLQDYQITLNSDKYAICILHTSSNHIPSGMNAMLLNLSVRQLAGERIQQKWKPYFFNYLGNLCMLASFDLDLCMPELTDEMDRFTRLAKSLLQAHITIGIGQTVDSLVDINMSYLGARQAVSYRAIYGTVRAINITEISPDETLINNDEMSDTEFRELFKLIKIGEHTEIQNFIHTFLKSSKYSSITSYDLFIMDLVGQLGRFVKNNGLNPKDIFGDDFATSITVQSKEPDAFETWLIDVCLKMADLLLYNRSTSTKDFVTKAKDYVHEHYMDPDLSMNSLCDELGVSVSYFSTVFKKETNTSFVKYLTDIRMNKAADLLIQEDEKSYIVATKVGYNDPNYFSYVFRKQFGVSPSKFKATK